MKEAEKFKEKGTKHRLMYLYAYLIKHTDADHPLSTNQLIKILQDEFDMHVGRNMLMAQEQEINDR